MYLLGLKFDLDEYTNWWNGPQASLYFWLIFLVFAVLTIGGLVLWARTTRSIKR